MAARLPQTTSVAAPSRGGINYERLYAYRFRHVDQASRQAVWQEIARYVHARMGAPDRMLDPARAAASSSQRFPRASAGGST